jgi:hypothetical protein
VNPTLLKEKRCLSPVVGIQRKEIAIRAKVIYAAFWPDSAGTISPLGMLFSIQFDGTAQFQ